MTKPRGFGLRVKIRGLFSGVPTIGIMRYWGLVLGHLFLGIRNLFLVAGIRVRRTEKSPFALLRCIVSSASTSTDQKPNIAWLHGWERLWPLGHSLLGLQNTSDVV